MFFANQKTFTKFHLFATSRWILSVFLLFNLMFELAAFYVFSFLLKTEKKHQKNNTKKTTNKKPTLKILCCISAKPKQTIFLFKKSFSKYLEFFFLILLNLQIHKTKLDFFLPFTNKQTFNKLPKVNCLLTCH